jgi:hypothetical protein
MFFTGDFIYYTPKSTGSYEHEARIEIIATEIENGNLTNFYWTTTYDDSAVNTNRFQYIVSNYDTLISSTTEYPLTGNIGKYLFRRGEEKETVDGITTTVKCAVIAQNP